MNVLVLGVGGIGGVICGYLARCGHSVAAVDRDEVHLSAIADAGLQIDGQESFVAKPTAVRSSELGYWTRRAELPDVICIAVKAADTTAALGLIADNPVLDRRLVVSLQNGWASFEAADLLGVDRVAAAHMTFSAYKEGPGRIRYTGAGTFRLGMLNGGHAADLAAFAAALAAFHPLELTDNIRGWLWAKAALSSFYYATALVSVDVPEIMARPEYRPALTHLVGEVALVAEARGVRLEIIDGFAPGVLGHEPWSSPAVAECWAAHARFWKGRLQQRTGVWRDLALHRRPTEIRGTESRILEWARAESIPTPLLRRVVEMITEAEEGDRELGWHNLDDLAAVDAGRPPDPVGEVVAPTITALPTQNPELSQGDRG